VHIYIDGFRTRGAEAVNAYACSCFPVPVVNSIRFACDTESDDALRDVGSLRTDCCACDRPVAAARADTWLRTDMLRPEQTLLPRAEKPDEAVVVALWRWNAIAETAAAVPFFTGLNGDILDTSKRIDDRLPRKCAPR